jgi:hypothetical protein
MSCRIKLTFQSPEVAKFLGRNTLRLRVTASDGEEMPDEVFLHQRTLVDADTDEWQDEFVAICSPYDLSDYPVDEPTTGQFPTYFRKATADIYLPGISVFSEVKEDIEAQIRFLVQLLNKLEELDTVEEIWIPDEPSSL